MDFVVGYALQNASEPYLQVPKTRSRGVYRSEIMLWRWLFGFSCHTKKIVHIISLEDRSVIIGKFSISPWNIVVKFFRLLSYIWFIPFGFYLGPIKTSGKIPHPLKPRNYRDITLNKMMFPDNISRAVIADKVAARGWVAERIGKKYLTPVYDICDTPEQLQLTDYPLPCVIKSNHASGQYHFVYSEKDFGGLKEKIRQWLSKEYNPKLEWVYRDIDRKIIVEEMLGDPRKGLTWDIKLFCFFGEPVLIRNTFGLTGDRQTSYVSPEWETLDVNDKKKPTVKAPDKPEMLEEILEVTNILASDFDFIRVDLLVHNGQLYFGELTNFPAAGCELFKPHVFDEYLVKEYNRLRREKIAEQRVEYRDLAEQLCLEQTR